MNIQVVTESARYRIGTVAQLTGLSADAIRAWERRYQTVAPVRTEGGTRLYSESDVTRLQLMKALTECGDSIGSIAALETDALRERLAKLASGNSNGEDRTVLDANREGPVRVAMLDAHLPAQLGANAADVAQLDIVTVAETAAELIEAAAQKPCDALVLNLGLLGSDPIATFDACVRASGARSAVVIYEFARRRHLARLADRGARLLKGPVSAGLLCRSVLDQHVIREATHRWNAEAELGPVPVLDSGEPVPERRFSDAELARLRELQASVECECPSHLADVVSNLAAFERYSRDCHSQSEEDADLHALLYRGTAQARALIEQLLVRVCRHDGIPI